MTTTKQSNCFLQFDKTYCHVVFYHPAEKTLLSQTVPISGIARSNPQLLKTLSDLNCYLALPSNQDNHLFLLEKPDVPEQFLEKAVKWQLVEKLNKDLDSVYVNYHPVRPAKDHLLVAVASRDPLDSLLKQCKKMGLTIKGAYLSDLLPACLPELFKEKKGLVIQLQPNRLGVFLVESGTMQDVIYLPNVNDKDFVSKISLILKKRLDQQGISLKDLAVFFIPSEQSEAVYDPISVFLKEAGCVLCNVETYLKNHSKADAFDGSEVPLYIGMQYLVSRSFPKSMINVLKHPSAVRFTIPKLGRYIRWGLVITTLILAGIAIKKTLHYADVTDQLGALKMDAAKYRDPLKTGKQGGTVALRIDQRRLTDNRSLYEWLLPLALHITPNTWINKITIDYKKSDFTLLGQTLFFKDVLSFSEALRENVLYAKLSIDLLKKKKIVKDIGYYEPTKKQSKRDILFHNWSIHTYKKSTRRRPSKS